MLNRRLCILALALLLSWLLVASGCQDDDDDDDNDDAADDDTTGDDDTGDDDTAGDDDDDHEGPSTVDCEPYGYGASPAIIRGPYLQHVTKNTIRILWQTNRPSNSIVRFGLEETLGYYQCGLEPTTFHEAELFLLSPETVYHYQVRSDGAQSNISTFATAPEADSPFTFVVYGDNRTRPVDHQKVVDGIEDQLPDLVINVGDVVTDGWDQEQYDTEFFDQVGDLMSRVPLYVSTGNHESESPFHYRYFSFPGREHWYSFDYGDARYIVLNSNRLHGPASKQYKWFKAELDRAQADEVSWLFVFTHHPAYSEGSLNYTDGDNIKAHLLPLMESYGVDIFFNGHTHDYERGELNGVVHLLTGGGGAGLSSWAKDVEHVTVYKSCHHFVMVDINGTTAQVTAIDKTGAEIDSFLLEH